MNINELKKLKNDVVFKMWSQTKLCESESEEVIEELCEGDRHALNLFKVMARTYTYTELTDLAGLFEALEDLVEKYKEQKSESNKAIKYFIFAKEVK